MSDNLANPKLWWAAAAIFAALAIGTAVRLMGLRGVPQDVADKRLSSLKTWWTVMTVLIASAFLGAMGLAVLFTAISFISLREFARMNPETQRNRQLENMAYLLIPLNYFCILMRWPQVFAVFLPLVSIGSFSTVLILHSQTEGFTHRAARAVWGLLVTVYFPAHAVLLSALPPESNPVAGVAGWFLLLVILTMWNDIAQALVGRRIGKHKMRPLVSPRKTWEGFWGGAIATSLLAVGLAPWLTPLSPAQAALSGLVIALAGSCGDLNMSAVKRDAGVKDSGQILPGQGGMLDRIDSLTFSAPAFYYLIVFMVEAAR